MEYQCPKGVLLMGFGGPDSLEAVEPFMTNILGGRKPPPPLVAKVLERYQLIGGKSPLPEITGAQAKAVEEALQAQGLACKVLVGMRNWHPYIGESLQQFSTEGIKEVIGLSLAPFYSRVSTGAYIQEIEQVLSHQELNLQVEVAPDWYNHPLFIAALAEHVNEALAGYSASEREKLQVIFSAHSLPVSHIEGGDPYVEQIKATIAKLLQQTGPLNWHFAYQSKGGGQGDWLGPEVEEVLDQLAAEEKRDVLLIPIGFVSDHIETLYDIDIAIKQHAQAKGIKFQRTLALNTSPKFIAALAEIARQEF